MKEELLKYAKGLNANDITLQWLEQDGVRDE